MDFFTWFLGKHFLIACAMFPELAFAYAVYQRWAISVALLALWIAFLRGMAMISFLRK